MSPANQCKPPEPADMGKPATVAPFSSEFQRQQKELSRRSHKDVTRGEFEDQQARLERLESLVQRLANNLTGFARRQVEMRADLLAAGAFGKKSKIIMPPDFN